MLIEQRGDYVVFSGDGCHLEIPRKDFAGSIGLVKGKRGFFFPAYTITLIFIAKGDKNTYTIVTSSSSKQTKIYTELLRYVGTEKPKPYREDKDERTPLL